MRILALVLVGVLLTSQVTFATPPPLLLPPRSEAPSKITIRASNQFACDLLQQLTRGKAEENLVFSPWSISSALAMTLEGAQGQTAVEMGQVLRLPAELRQQGARPWNLEPYHSGFADLQRSLQPNTANDQAVRLRIARLRQDLDVLNNQLRRNNNDFSPQAQAAGHRAEQLANTINDLQQQVDQYELSVANSVWVDQSQSVERNFAGQLARYYSTGSFQSADFVNRFPAERQRINHWVEMQTRNKIKDLIPIVDPTFLRMILVNAIYFKGQWSTPFEADATRPQPFHTSNGGNVPRPSMHRTFTVGYAAFQGDGSYFETPRFINPGGNEPRYPNDNGFLVAELPYKGDKLAMVVIAPRSPRGLPALQANLTGANLETWLRKLDQREAHVTLPKFKVDSSMPDMQDTLQQLGMKDAFSRFAANFYGIHRPSGPQDNLFISKVVHKAFIEVNEKGSEAAAATAVMMAMPGAAPMMGPRMVPFIPEFRADRPFLFLIRDTRSGAVLFLGRVTLPEA